MMAVRDRPLADRRPDPTGHRLQAEPALVGREDLDRRAGMARRFLGDDFGEFFLKASCSSGVAGLIKPKARPAPPKAWRQAPNNAGHPLKSAPPSHPDTPTASAE